MSLDKIKEAGIHLKQISGAPNYLYQPLQISQEYKLCMNKNLYSNYVSQPSDKGWFCQEIYKADDQKSAAKNLQPSLNVEIRSTNNVFEFLGQVVRAQLEDPPYLLTLPPTDKTFNMNKGKLNQYALLVANKDKATSRPFSKIESLDGSTYTIPSEDAGYSALSIKLLAQFMSLQKIPGSIPPSPAVLIK